MIKNSSFISRIIKKKIKEIEKNGYCRINNFLSKKITKKLLSSVEKNYFKNKKIKYVGVPSRDVEDKILYNLQNKDYNFIKVLSDKRIIKIAKYFLDDPYYRFLSDDKPNYILNYFNARSSGKKLDLHIDSWIPYMGKKTHMMQFVFLLEDSTDTNGCTVVVRGSHTSGKYTDRNSKKIINLTGAAGDLIIWDSRLWHGTLENFDKISRWAIVTTLSSWWIKQAMDMPRSLPKKIYKKCSNFQKQLIGYCSVPPEDELRRINTKCGYEVLK
jgi:ectoine hydroxylase-related dioxygenase (phytanoyl-CoA dioxygenase family)